MKATPSHRSVSDCLDNHEIQYYEPSLDAYVCSTCDSEFPLLKDYELQEDDDEYELHIGI